MQSKRRTDAEWMDIIQKCRNSGLSDQTWCEQNHISINTFYNTISRLRKKSCAIPKTVCCQFGEETEIVSLPILEDSELQMPNPAQLKQSTDCNWSATASAALTIRVKNCTVDIQNHACRDLIYNTLLALQQL